MHNKRINAFTMIELLVVFSIVAILVTVGVSTYSEYRVKANVANMLNSTAPAKLAIANDYFNQGYTFANSNYSSGSQPYVVPHTDTITSIDISAGIITVTGNSARLGGRSIVLVFTPTVTNNNITWTCAVSTSYFAFVPDSCKNAL